MRFVFHIGAPKTGTTSIQAAIHEARSEFLAHGVYVFGGDAPNADVMQHRVVRFTDPEVSGVAERSTALRVELERAKLLGCHTVLLSSELAFTPPSGRPPERRWGLLV